MLCQFTVENFKSIREEITLDMQTAAISEHEDKIIKDIDGETYLPVSVIYGPNGGGKSNIMHAIFSLRRKIVFPLYIAEGDNEINIPVSKYTIKPFAFGTEELESPTKFEVFFRTKKAEYRYILWVKNDIVIYESLDRIKFDTGRTSSLFERSEKEINLKGDLKKLKISNDISENLTLLSYLGITYRKNEIIDDVINWFKHEILVINYGNPIRELTMATVDTEEAKKIFINMLREMDIDIVDYRIEEENNKKKIFTIHSVNDKKYELNLNEESSGTKKMFDLLPFIIKSFVEGTTLIIDELDAKVHPILLKYIINLYTDMEINKNKAQLIFTSHDMTTMNSETFRRDEIWFVAKGNQQNSKLYSLVEFKDKDGKTIRKDAKFDKQYLEGKYGADPYLKKIIDWGEINGKERMEKTP